MSEFLPIILSEQHTDRYYLPVCLNCLHASQNVPFSPIWGSFLLVFSFLLAYGFICTHPTRFAPIYTHPHHFSPHTPKHDVRGNFPGHSTQILTCATLKSPQLPVFRVPRAPCAPTHPHAPIRINFHLFVPVCTLHFHVYMYILMQK